MLINRSLVNRKTQEYGVWDLGQRQELLKIPNGNLVTYYDVANPRCTGGSGTSIIDLNGNTNSSFSIDTAFAYRYEWSAYFNWSGGNSQQWNLANPVSLRPNGAFTILTWAFITSDIGSNTRRILTYGDISPVVLMTVSDATTSTASWFYNGTTFHTLTVPKNQWWMMGIGYDPTTTTARAYYNGQILISSSITASTTSNLTWTSGYGAGGNTNTGWKGGISTISGYSKLLDESESYTWFNATRLRYRV